MNNTDKYILWYTNQNCSARRGNVKPSADYTPEELEELRNDDDLTVWEDMTAEEIRESAAVIPHNLRGGIDVALGYLDMYDDAADRILTDGGEYTVVKVLERMTTDETIGLCIGRADDGHYDLIASDNASNWLVGGPDDAERNRDMFAALAEAGTVIDLEEIRDVDEALADFIAERQQAAENYAE